MLFLECTNKLSRVALKGKILISTYVCLFLYLHELYFYGLAYFCVYKFRLNHKNDQVKTLTRIRWPKMFCLSLTRITPVLKSEFSMNSYRYRLTIFISRDERIFLFHEYNVYIYEGTISFWLDSIKKTNIVFNSAEQMWSWCRTLRPKKKLLRIRALNFGMSCIKLQFYPFFCCKGQVCLFFW